MKKISLQLFLTQIDNPKPSAGSTCAPSPRALGRSDGSFHRWRHPAMTESRISQPQGTELCWWARRAPGKLRLILTMNWLLLFVPLAVSLEVLAPERYLLVF